MRTLITGGAGFIGSHLAEALLDRGHYVSVLDNLSTGRIENIAHLRHRSGFALHHRFGGERAAGGRFDRRGGRDVSSCGSRRCEARGRLAGPDH